MLDPRYPHNPSNGGVSAFQFLAYHLDLSLLHHNPDTDWIWTLLSCGYFSNNYFTIDTNTSPCSHHRQVPMSGYSSSDFTFGLTDCNPHLFGKNSEAKLQTPIHFKEYKESHLLPRISNLASGHMDLVPTHTCELNHHHPIPLPLRASILPLINQQIKLH